MNNSVPACNFQSNSSFTYQKNPMGPDQELVELLWPKGQVVLNSQSQTHKKPVLNSVNSRRVQNNDQSALKTSGSYGNSSNLFQEDETVSWIQFPLEDPLEQELCSDFLPELRSSEIEPDKPNKWFEEEKFAKFTTDGASHLTATSQPSTMKLPSVQKFPGNPILSPRFFPDSSQKNVEFYGSPKVLNFSEFTAVPKVASTSSIAQHGEKGTGNMLQNEAGEGSVMTAGSSHCGSNQIPRDRDVSRISSKGFWTTNLLAEPSVFRDNVRRTFPMGEKGKSETHEPTVTSSSGGSGSSLEKTCCQSTSIHSQKSKGTDAEELEKQSETTELKSVARKRAAQRTGSSRRNRAAEVHNLSERRRRDRINEKMRALQQLIPHSNKTDKASMLDEAIEYLKSLQFQLQMMLMGAGMTPVMIPGIQHYMSQMDMGLATPSLSNHMNIPRVDQSISMSRAPNQTVTFKAPVLAPFNYQNHMQNPALSEQYARCMGYHLMQSASQPMNALSYGSQTVQHSQTMIPASNNNGPLSGAANTIDAVGGRMGKPQ
ncbi:transcription factor PIF4-like [Prosopis cineraria]|uniref:transcription factor PIF4-like n=1 Tax=Prosopis cineraria TaxID=364024 RepID=UPI00240FFB74|nr:transcription factor PIF4-like [Prosopis cineraria]XP_054799916.1 transcription factor PIF4-like [Prosopis cineraria]